MGKLANAYADRKGDLHSSADNATLADLGDRLGNQVYARKVLEDRAEIEAIFREHDDMMNPQRAHAAPVPTVSLQLAVPLVEAVRELLDNREHLDLCEDDHDMLLDAVRPVEQALGLT